MISKRVIRKLIVITRITITMVVVMIVIVLNSSNDRCMIALCNHSLYREGEVGVMDLTADVVMEGADVKKVSCLR